MVYQLLVVDDEPYIAQNLAQFVQLRFLGREDDTLETSFVCSAKEALEKMRRMRFHILLTDVNMPGMPGTELAHVVSEQWPECKIIFLSGYDEFRYVQEAVRARASDYILKSENHTLILSAVEQAIVQLRALMEMKAAAVVPPHLWNGAKPVMLSDYLNALLLASQPDAVSILPELGFAHDPQARFFPMICRLHAGEAIVTFMDLRQRFLKIETIIRQYLGDAEAVTFFLSRNDELICLFPASDASRETQAHRHLASALELAIEACAVSSLDISMTLNSRAMPLSTLHAFYRSEASLADEVGIACSGVLFSQFDVTQTLPDADRSAFVQFDAHMEALRKALRGMDSHRFFAAFDIARRQTERFGTQAEHLAQVLFLKVSNLLTEYMHEHELPLAALGPSAGHKVFHYGQYPSRKAAFEALYSVGERVFEQQRQSRNRQADRLIHQINRYVLANLRVDLRLSDIAEHFNFNASYLSRVYSQATGVGLQKYINHAKVEHAADLLEHTSMKINDIMWKCGYQNSSYFSKLFKSLKGSTPSEYRMAAQSTRREDA